MPHPALLSLGVDFGTSGVRASIVDDDGVQQAFASTANSGIETPCERCREQSPDSWWDGLVQTLEKLPPKLLGGVGVIAVDGTSGTLLLCDRNVKPLTQGLMYHDSRAQAAAKDIQAIATAESGAHGATSSLAKLLWLNEYADTSNVRYALHQADWIANRLCGQYGFSDENNALKLGYDPIHGQWPQWMEMLGFPMRWLPEVCKPGQKIGMITAENARKLKINPKAIVAAGTTDSIAAFIATGASQIGDAVTSLGSTMVVKLIAEQPLFAPEYGVYSHKLGDHWLVGGASNTGGAVLLEYFSVKELKSLSSRIDLTQPTNLNYYPLPGKGERFPINEPDMTSRISPDIRPDQVRFLQGLFEGMANIECMAYEKLHTLGAGLPKRIFTTGGGAANPIWQKIREQSLPCPLLSPQHTQAAHGAAILARNSL